MSDFLFSSKRTIPGALAEILGSMYMEKAPACSEFHGEWGSLAVVLNRYPGFEPFENSRHILVVIGGPSPAWPGAPSRAGNTGGNACTEHIFERWLLRGEMTWESDLRGAFALFCVDKESREVKVVTDMFSCVPVYRATPGNGNAGHILGSHPDLCARAAGRADRPDLVSAANLLVTGWITFPYTLYDGVRQLPPGSAIRFDSSGISEEKSYWVPRERREFSSMKDAAAALRENITASVETACAGCGHAGLFLSGGEDSRTVLAAMPGEIRKTAFTFLDSQNREGRIAGDIARRYGAEHRIGIRSPDYYQNHMEACARLGGSQNEWRSFHALGMNREFHLDEYAAILDGWWADALLKGYWIFTESSSLKGVPLTPSRIANRRIGLSGDLEHRYGSFLLDRGVFSPIETPLNPDIHAAVAGRIRRRVEALSEIRPDSAEEWLYVWPLTQNQGSQNFLGHRRLFRHYSIYLDQRIAKIGSAVPQEWKINRRLFHEAVKPLLRKSRFAVHPSGALPWFGEEANIPVRLAVRSWWKLMKTLRIDPLPSDFPWPDWKRVSDSESMSAAAMTLEPYCHGLEPLFGNGADDVSKGRGPFPPIMYLRLLQVLCCRKLAAGPEV